MTEQDHHRTWGRVPEMLAECGGDPEIATQAFIAQLDDAELMHMISGDRSVLHEIVEGLRGNYNSVPYPSGANSRCAYPGFRFADGPRGIVVGNSTAFPVPMARAATFDPALELEIGEAIGREGTAQGANLFGGVCINLVRHPAWGRSQESYGEDSVLLGRMGAALTKSIGNHMIACIKHFALNSMENSRLFVDVRVADADLEDIYLPHFKACVDAGALAVMSAYNKVNGRWAGQNAALLNHMLKDSWGFEGVVMSDFMMGIHDMPEALRSGQDVEMPFSFRSRAVPRAVRDGTLEMTLVRGAATRSARAVFTQASRTGASVADPSVINCAEHRELADRCAADSIVLLTNTTVGGGPALPLAGTGSMPVGSVALIGDLAGIAQTGDNGSSRVRSRCVVSPAEGFRAYVPRLGIELRESLSDAPGAARSVASRVDAAVVVVGNTHRDEGEFVVLYGGDRRRLELPRSHVALIESVAAVCPRTIVVLVGGSAFVTESWRDQVASVVMGWYLGDEAGNALAKVILGESSPGGRLPVTWPATESQLPHYRRWTRRITYGPLHGYRLFHETKQAPAFWFGHGLSYTTFEWGAPRRSVDGTEITVSVSNAGGRAGSEVVQAYLEVALGTHSSPLPTLCGFSKVRLEPAEQHDVIVPVDAGLLAKARDQALARGDGEPRLWVGRSAAPSGLMACVETGNGSAKPEWTTTED